MYFAESGSRSRLLLYPDPILGQGFFFNIKIIYNWEFFKFFIKNHNICLLKHLQSVSSGFLNMKFQNFTCKGERIRIGGCESTGPVTLSAEPYPYLYRIMLWTRNIDSMKRLDQGHLHPLLEHPRETCLIQESNPVCLRHRRKL
jgi:hypothetical protein